MTFTVSRRRFIGGALATGGAAALLDGWLARGLAGADPLGPGEGTLVVIALDGGCDSLDTVRPVSVAAGVDLVQGARPTLARAGGLPLDADYALHPALTNLHGLWNQGQLAIVHGAGDTHYTELSHFEAIDIHAHGRAGAATGPTGWLGRYLDAMPGSPLTGVHLGDEVPLELVGATNSGISLPLSMSNVSSGGLAVDQRIAQAVREFGAAPTGLGAVGDRWASTAVLALDVAQDVGPAYAPGGTPTLPEVAIAMGELLNLDLGIRVLTLAQLGYDFHASLRPGQDDLLAQLDAALGAFFGVLDPAVRDRTAVLLHSEFGRRVAENTSEGTDHGEGGMMLLIGNKVTGGHHGEAPSLLPTELHLGNLVPTVDFRRVYAGAVEDWLGGDANEVIGAGYSASKIPLFTSGP